MLITLVNANRIWKASLKRTLVNLKAIEALKTGPLYRSQRHTGGLVLNESPSPYPYCYITDLS